ncbi:MAG: hypothetical protein PUD60_04930 [Akkermansia muciniphila]|nr:hypothetical protein [Akkermansia muciniphila]
MRLHLPKTLLAAVLAACASLDAYAGVSGSAFEINSTETNDSASMSGYATFVDGEYSSVNTDPAGKPAVTTIRPGDSTTGTIEVLNVASDKALSISAKGTSNFTDLTISRINVAETGSATLNIAGAQVVRIGGASGTVNFSVSGAGAGELILNGSGAYGNYSTSTDNYTRKIKVTNSSIVTFDTVTNSWGMGAIDIDAASELKATSIILKSGDNKGGDLQGGKITGDGSANVTTLTVGNVGNYTINVANFGAGTLNADWVNASKQLTLSSSTLKIGTLNQTNGTIKITSATSAAITSLNISGGIIDASEMTGTLTISGATWTGGLAAASVEVLKAKDADTATSLANSMNPSSLLNYMFKAGDADAGEAASSVYRVRREYITATATVDSNDKNRIVIGSVTGADGSTFTNVALKDLLAGDKVTLGTAADEEAGTVAQDLTGWIGYNNDIILADLEFAAGTTTHVNDGNAGGTITYSGAITGTGTLSFDWSGKTNTYVFTGDLSRFTGMIKDDATLNVTIGGTPATEAAKKVNATIDIAGILTVNRETTFTKGFTAKQLNGNQRIYIEGDQTITCTQDGNYSANIDVKSGKLTVGGFVKTSGELDMKKSDNYTGYVEVARGGVLTVGSNIWGLAATSKILLQEEGSLKWNGFTITGKAAKEGVDTGLKFGVDGALALNNANHTVTNSVITYTGRDEKTLGWTLTNTDLVVQSGRLSLGKDVSAATVTVKSGGTLELLTGYTQNVTANTWAWEEGSTLSYGRSGTGNDIVDLGVSVGTVSGTTIELHGVLGTLKAVSSSIKRDIKLTNTSAAAGEFTTIEGDSYTFDGKVKGGGNFALAQASKTTSLIFNGDLSDWTSGSDGYSGLRAVSGTVNATISGTPTNNVVSNAFNKDSGGTLNLTIARDAVLTNKMNITSLAVNDGKTLELRNDTNAVAVGNTTVGAGSKLILDNKRTAEDGTTTYGSINLGTVSGSGTISSSMESQSISLSTDKAKTFSGTLEATSGKLTVTGMSIADGYHLMTALKAAGGNLDLMNTPLVSITEMVIGENATVGVYGGTTASEENEGGVFVHGVGASTKGALTVESGATLKSDLQLVNTVLTFNGSLTMGSDLTLYSGNELAGSLYTSWDKKSALTLFTGVDNLTIGTEVAVADKEYKASEVFSNIGNDYSLKMTGSTGDYIVQLVQSTPAPEPTTATLSLLALMGLAARRRRRKA